MKGKQPKKPRKPYAVLLALVIALCSPYALAAPKKGDFIAGLGWAYSADTSELSNRVDGPVLSGEIFATDKLSLRLDYARFEAEALITAPASPVETDHAVVQPSRRFLDRYSAKGFSLAVAPHFGNLSFPVGLVGVDVPGRHSPVWGGTAGAWLDFWNSRHFGIGLGASYEYLDNTVLNANFLDARGLARFKF